MSLHLGERRIHGGSKLPNLLPRMHLHRQGDRTAALPCSIGIAPGARRPGAKKAPAAPTAKPAAPQPEPDTDGESAPAPEPSGEGNGETPAPPVKGLGIAKGARPPGKR